MISHPLRQSAFTREIDASRLAERIVLTQNENRLNRLYLHTIPRYEDLVAEGVRFDRRLDLLWDKRVEHLRKAVREGGAQRSGLRKNFARSRINSIVQAAEKSLAQKIGKRALLDHADDRDSWRVKGRGPVQKMESFKKWYDLKVEHFNSVYIFWQGNRCLYVGRTRHGRGRPAQHFRSHWGHRADRVVVYSFKGQRNLPMLECLAIHWYDPAYNLKRASQRQRTPKCPVCTMRRLLRMELRHIFVASPKR